MDAAKADELRKPFPKDTVGVLPKPYKKDSPKAKCRECDGYHGMPAVHLDFVGHAAVTDRLLTVDPDWTWEPFATGADGLPALDRQGNLWIRLTVAGVTRIGIGDGTSLKETIGDAIRNAAMRFGVALSLWTKDELESGHAEDKAAEPLHTAETRPQTDSVPALKRRVWAAASFVMPKDVDPGEWVTNGLIAKGYDSENAGDLLKFALELEAAAK